MWESMTEVLCYNRQKMKRYIAVLLLALLQALCCSGVPQYQSDLASMSEKALGVAMTQVNKLYAGLRLYRVTRGSVKRVVPIGLNTYDLMLNFGIKETDCLKSSGEDPQRCAFRLGFFVTPASCTSRVRVSRDLAEVVSLNCGKDSSSSSESSEETFARKRPFNLDPFENRGPAQPVSGFSDDPSGSPGLPFPGQELAPPKIPRGDSFSNHLQ
ncbi:secreted phosphoprotein 24 precursor [Esox lucius]|uniref:Secreted phosphoprotein 24 n=1 Tax=Esox lucius TaxID=8010 RepID=C1BYK3_ESOLU|nr:secreted phosphoprotein 24 precursor [Esox lucius]ACO14106.1 Secreted phosphoprotein 24 precursor [Esox lucius]